MSAVRLKPQSEDGEEAVILSEQPTGHENESVRAKIDEVGVLSYITFGWIFEYLWQAYRGKVPPNRAWPCSIFDAANVNTTRLEHLWTQEIKKRGTANASLFRVIIQFMSQRLAIACFIFFFCLAFGFIGPTCLVRGLISYTENPSLAASDDDWTGYYLVFGILAVELARVGMYGATWAISYRTGIRVRGAVLSLLYKSLIHSKSLEKKTSAEIVNICANDGQRLFDAVTFAPLVLVGPFVIVGGVIYLFRIVGAWSLLGLLVFVLFDILQVFLGITMVRCRRRAIANTEERLGLMGEILQNIRLIKSSCWEELFMKRVVDVRNRETRNIQTAGYAQSLAIASGTVVPVIATIVTVLAVVQSGHDLLASDAFSMITVYFVMLFGIRMIPYGARYLGEAYTAIKKIQDLLLYAKYEPNLAIESQSASATKITDATFTWSSAEEPSVPIKGANSDEMVSQLVKPNDGEGVCLHDVNLTINKREKIGVCGAVGAGKTALLNSILGTTTCKRGTISVSGTVAYASAKPCIVSGTVRDNILFGASMNTQRYERAIYFSQLAKDLERMTANEMSNVGEAGAALSGGQKARVSLARCFFSQRDIYLIDDVLSAVNVEVADRIFNDAIGGWLANKTVLIVTTNPKYLAKCDRVVFMQESKMTAVETHDTLINNNADYRHLFEITPVAEPEDDRSVTSVKSPTANGSAKTNGTLSNGDAAATTKETVVEEEENLGLQSISKDVYLEYIEAAGGRVVFALIVLLFAANIASSIFSVLWLSKWMKDVHGAPNEAPAANRTLANNEHLSFYAGIYIASVVMLFITGLLKAVAFVKLCMKASSSLHKRMLKHILHAVVSFFDVTPKGRILNRFSKDFDEIDVKLPFSFEALLQYMITCTGFLLTICWVFPIFIVACIPLAGIFTVFFLCFRAGIRSLKRAENVSRSPVFNQVNASLDGLATIHAFGQHQRNVETFRLRLDENSSAMFMFNAAMRWQAVWLDLLVVAVTFVVSALIVALSSSIAPSDAGMALAFALQMSGVFQFAVRSQTELESKLTAVERVQHYYKVGETRRRKERVLLQNVEQERQNEELEVPTAWPENGDLAFEDVTLRYRQDERPALSHVSFNVADGEHVAVIGRTGAGKTSLTNALFRLHPLESGIVRVGGVDTSRLPLARLRQAMVLVPQESGLFSGTLRFNLDPAAEFDDDRLWEALERVDLKQFVSTTDAKLALPIECDGRNLSTGQRQLVIMARTLLRNVRILVMDEATAAIDHRADSHVQRAVGDAFARRTVFIISHRAETLADCSRRLRVADGIVHDESTSAVAAAVVDGDKTESRSSAESIVETKQQHDTTAETRQQPDTTVETISDPKSDK